jgi:NAD(P)-dependent dehydrogenase (short-subunit alcohol dehydrogenase family)
MFRRELDIDLVGQLLVTQVMLPALLAEANDRGNARIVMMGSIGAGSPAPWAPTTPPSTG